MKNRLSVTGKAAGTAAEASESRTRTAPAVERTTENGTDLHLPDEASVSAGTVKSDRPPNFTLRNGLQVVVIPDHRTPVVTLEAAFCANAFKQGDNPGWIFRVIKVGALKPERTLSAASRKRPPRVRTAMATVHSNKSFSIHRTSLGELCVQDKDRRAGHQTRASFGRPISLPHRCWPSAGAPLRIRSCSPWPDNLAAERCMVAIASPTRFSLRISRHSSPE